MTSRPEAEGRPRGRTRAVATRRHLEDRVDAVVAEQVAIAERRLAGRIDAETSPDLEPIATAIAEGLLDPVIATLDDDPTRSEVTAVRRLFDLD